MRDPHRPSKIPTFASLEEEAAFWDGHDLGEFEDELEPVEVEVDPNLGHVLSVRVEAAEIRRLGAIARQRGVGVVELARLLVLEGLNRAEADAEPAGRALAD